MAISMLKIRRPLGRLIFNMRIATPGKTVFLIETAPRWQLQKQIIFLIDKISIWQKFISDIISNILPCGKLTLGCILGSYQTGNKSLCDTMSTHF